MFQPLLNPYQMLQLGVFDGNYFDYDATEMQCLLPLPPELNNHLDIAEENLFMEGASQPKALWEEKGWITPEDPCGWFQWYIRYYKGRRIPELDAWQQKRWRSFTARHGAQVCKNRNGDLTKRLKQRQALLHWGADPIPDVDISPEEKISYLFTKKQLTIMSDPGIIENIESWRSV